MYVVNKENSSISFEVSSQLKNIDRIVKEIKEFILLKKTYSLQELEQVLRELMLNAVEHGNRNDMAKNFSVSLSFVNDNRIELEVTDEGEGFGNDFFPIKRECRQGDPRNRGLILVNSIVDELKLGNTKSSIKAYLTLNIAFNWGVTQTDDTLQIMPVSNFSASSLEELRTILFQWLDENRSNCVLNLVNIDVLDSVTLSFLISFSQYLKREKRETEFLITEVHPLIMELFQLTQICSLYTVVEQQR